MVSVLVNKFSLSSKKSLKKVLLMLSILRMTKTETEKEILALRYPIDVDVTDDIFKKR